MARDLISNPVIASDGVEPLSSVVSAAAVPRSTQETPLEAIEQDALAGVLPEWDLLPAAPFIRRLK